MSTPAISGKTVRRRIALVDSPPDPPGYGACIGSEGPPASQDRGVVDFSFIHDRVAGLYCPDNGRPPRARGQAEGLLLDHRIGTAGSASSPRRMQLRPTFVTQSSIWGGSTASGSALTLTSRRIERRLCDFRHRRRLEQRRMLGVIGYRVSTPPRVGMMASKLFTYEPERDGYRCPQSNCSPTSAPIAPATVTLRRSAKPVRCWPHAHQTAAPLDGSFAMSGPTPASGPMPIGSRREQAHLQAPQGDLGTIFCRRQATPRPSRRSLPRSACRGLPVPPRCRRPQRQKDRSLPGPSLA